MDDGRHAGYPAVNAQRAFKSETVSSSSASTRSVFVGDTIVKERMHVPMKMADLETIRAGWRGWLTHVQRGARNNAEVPKAPRLFEILLPIKRESTLVQ